MNVGPKNKKDLVYEYQQSNEYFAQIAGGLEELGAAELEELGAKSVRPGYRGLYFSGDPSVLRRINYGTRLCTRILAPLLTFDCHSDKYLYRTARNIDWSDLIRVDGSFAVFATVSNSKITHSKYAALRLKDAIVDQFRDNTGRRPNVDRRNPDIWLNLHINANRAVISMDTSGGSLHRRGYRVDSGVAPMQETVAAAIIRMSGWHGEIPLHDPMCGSGTLMAEALMVATHTPAGYLRNNFGFEHLPDYDAASWKKEKAETDEKIVDIPEGLLHAGDKSREALDAARRSLRRLPEGNKVAFREGDYRKLGGIKDAVIVTNPPYGIRMGERMQEFYRELGDFLKQRCTDSTAYIYFGERENLKFIGLRSSWKKPLVSGSLDGRLAKFELY